MLHALAISGYRSLRDLRLALAPVTVVTGGNGVGKSSLYRALRLMADVAQGRVVASLAGEGGFASTLWAGPETIGRAVRQGRQPLQGTVRSGPVSLKLGFSTSDYGYAIDLGLPIPGSRYFDSDPEVKLETLWLGRDLTRNNAIARRQGPLVRIRDEKGLWSDVMTSLGRAESMMTHCADPRFGFELLTLRERMRGWRFYDHFRCYRDAPARRARVGTFTPVLADDGSDLAAAIATINEIGAAETLAKAVDDAFPGASLEIAARGDFELVMRQHGLLRPLSAAELSDGTLRYLLWIAALLSPRPPEFMVLNEPETSLHPDLIGPLARLILHAATSSQVIVITHDDTLADALDSDARAIRVGLTKDFGETLAEDREPPPWTWDKR